MWIVTYASKKSESSSKHATREEALLVYQERLARLQKWLGMTGVTCNHPPSGHMATRFDVPGDTSIIGLARLDLSR